MLSWSVTLTYLTLTGHYQIPLMIFILLNLCVQHGLHQFVSAPTREDHILDLVLSSDHNIVSDLCVTETFSDSDHSTAEFNLIVRHHDSRPSAPTVTYDFDHADYDGISAYLLNDPFMSCPRFEQGITVDQAWGQFTKPLEEAIAYNFLSLSEGYMQTLQSR